MFRRPVLRSCGARPRVWVAPPATARAFTPTARSCRSDPTHPASEPDASRPLAFAFDIDGVLKAGNTVLDAARRALAILEGNNPLGRRVPYIFITNGGGPSEVDRAKNLSKNFGLEVKPDQVIQAHTVLQSLTKRFGNKPVLMIGGPDYPPGASRTVMNG